MAYFFPAVSVCGYNQPSAVLRVFHCHRAGVRGRPDHQRGWTHGQDRPPHQG